MDAERRNELWAKVTPVSGGDASALSNFDRVPVEINRGELRDLLAKTDALERVKALPRYNTELVGDVHGPAIDSTKADDGEWIDAEELDRALGRD